MLQLDWQIYEDQKGPRVGKYLDAVEKFEQADIDFLKKFHVNKKSAMYHHAPLVLMEARLIASHQTLNQ